MKLLTKILVSIINFLWIYLLTILFYRVINEDYAYLFFTISIFIMIGLSVLGKNKMYLYKITLALFIVSFGIKYPPLLVIFLSVFLLMLHVNDVKIIIRLFVRKIKR